MSDQEIKENKILMIWFVRSMQWVVGRMVLIMTIGDNVRVLFTWSVEYSCKIMKNQKKRMT